MVAHEGDLAVALVGRTVDPVLPGLAPKAADLMGGGWREAAAEVFVQEQSAAMVPAVAGGLSLVPPKRW